MRRMTTDEIPPPPRSTRLHAFGAAALLLFAVPTTLLAQTACGGQHRPLRETVLDAAEVLCAIEHALEPQPVIDQLCSIEEQHRDAIHKIVVGVRGRVGAAASASASASAPTVAPSAPTPAPRSGMRRGGSNPALLLAMPGERRGRPASFVRMTLPASPPGGPADIKPPEPVRALYRQGAPKYKHGIPIAPESYTIGADLIEIPDARVGYVRHTPKTGWVQVAFLRAEGDCTRVEGVSVEEAAARDIEAKLPPGPLPPPPPRERQRTAVRGVRGKLSGQTTFELADKIKRRARPGDENEPDFDADSIYLGDLARVLGCDDDGLVDVGQLAGIYAVLQKDKFVDGRREPQGAWIYIRSMDKPFTVRLDLGPLDCNVLGRLLAELSDSVDDEEWSYAYEQVPFEYVTTYTSPPSNDAEPETGLATVPTGFWGGLIHALRSMRTRFALSLSATARKVSRFVRSLFS